MAAAMAVILLVLIELKGNYKKYIKEIQYGV